LIAFIIKVCYNVATMYSSYFSNFRPL